MKTTRALNKFHTGFSLLELLISICLVSSLALWGILQMVTLRNYHKLKHEAFTVEAAIERLSLESGLREKKLVLDLNKTGFRAYDPDRLTTYIINHKWPVGINITKDQILPFFPSGVTQPATLILTLKKASCALTLALRGRVTTSCSA